MSNEVCRRTMTALVEAVGPLGDYELDEEASAHAASCPRCGAAAQRVRETVDGLDAWTVPEPADDLVDRTLERALASMAAGPIDPLAEELEPAAAAVAPATAVIAAPAPAAVAAAPAGPERPTGYVAVARPSELLTRRFGTGERPAATVDSPMRTVVLRVLSQVIAASFVFILSGAFTVYFYPAFTEALEERRVNRCQHKLGSIRARIFRYLRDHPEREGLSPDAIVSRLIEDGEIAEDELVCPAAANRSASSYYVSSIPLGESEQPLLWDKFGNHEEGVSVLYSTGRVEFVDGPSLPFRLSAVQRKTPPDAEPQGD